MRKNRWRSALGFIMVLLGLYWLGKSLGLEINLRPIFSFFLIVAGLYLLIRAATGSWGGYAAIGTFLALIGLYFFLFALDVLPNYEMRPVWPWLLFSAGVGMAVASLYPAGRPFWPLAVILIGTGLLSLLYYHCFFTSLVFWHLWRLGLPFLLIGLGIYLVYKATRFIARRRVS